jgi:Flp pilus assembly protein TadG
MKKIKTFLVVSLVLVFVSLAVQSWASLTNAIATNARLTVASGN